MIKVMDETLGFKNNKPLDRGPTNDSSHIELNAQLAGGTFENEHVETLVGITVPTKEDWSEEFDFSNSLLLRVGKKELHNRKVSAKETIQLDNPTLQENKKHSLTSNTSQNLDWAAENCTSQVYSQLERGSAHFDPDDQKWQAFKASKKAASIRGIIRSLATHNSNGQIIPSETEKLIQQTAIEIPDAIEVQDTLFDEDTAVEINIHAQKQNNPDIISNDDLDLNVEAEDSDSSFEDWDEEFETDATSEVTNHSTSPTHFAHSSLQHATFHAQLEGLRNIVNQTQDSLQSEESPHISLLQNNYRFSQHLEQKKPVPNIIRFPKSSLLYSLRTAHGHQCMPETTHQSWLQVVGQREDQAFESMEYTVREVKGCKRTINRCKPGVPKWCSAYLHLCRILMNIKRDREQCLQQILKFFNSFEGISKSKKHRKSIEKSNTGSFANNSGEIARLLSLDNRKRSEGEIEVELPVWACLLDVGIKLMGIYLQCFHDEMFLDHPHLSERKLWSTNSTKIAKPEFSRFCQIISEFGKNCVTLVNPIIPSTLTLALKLIQAEGVIHGLVMANKSNAKSVTIQDNVDLILANAKYDAMPSSASAKLSPELQVFEAAILHFCQIYSESEAIELARLSKQDGESTQQLWVETTHPDILQVSTLCNIQLMMYGMSPITLEDQSYLLDQLESLRLALELWADEAGYNFETTDINSILALGAIHHLQQELENGQIEESKRNQEHHEATIEIWMQLCSFDPTFRMRKLLELFPRIEGATFLKAKAAYTLAHYYLTVVGDLETAESLFFECLYVLDTMSTKHYSPILSNFGVKVLVEYGDVLVENKKYKYAISAYESAARVYVGMEKKENQKLLRKLCSVCVEHKDWDRALRYHQRVLHKCCSNGNINEYIYLSERIADMLVEQKADFENAVKVLETAIAFLEGNKQQNEMFGDQLPKSNYVRDGVHYRFSHDNISPVSEEGISPCTSTSSSSISPSINLYSPSQTSCSTPQIQASSSRSFIQTNSKSKDRSQTERQNHFGSTTVKHTTSLTPHEHNLHIKLQMKLVHVQLSANRPLDALTQLSDALARAIGQVSGNLVSSIYLLLAKVCLKLRWLADGQLALEAAAKIHDPSWSMKSLGSVESTIFTNAGYPLNKELYAQNSEMRTEIEAQIDVIRTHLLLVPNEMFVGYVVLCARCMAYQGDCVRALVWIDQALLLSGVDPANGESTNNRNSIESVVTGFVLPLGHIGKLFFYKSKIIEMLLHQHAPLIQLSTQFQPDLGTESPQHEQKSSQDDIEGRQQPIELSVVRKACVKACWNAYQYFGVINDMIWQTKTLSRVANVELHEIISQMECAVNNDGPSENVKLCATKASIDELKQRCKQPCTLSTDMCADIGYPPLMIRCLLNMMELSLLQNELHKGREYWKEACVILFAYYLTDNAIQLSEYDTNVVDMTTISQLKIPAVKCPPGMTKRILMATTRLLRAVALFPSILHNCENRYNTLLMSWNWLNDELASQLLYVDTHALTWNHTSTTFTMEEHFQNIPLHEQENIIGNKVDHSSTSGKSTPPLHSFFSRGTSKSISNPKKSDNHKEIQLKSIVRLDEIGQKWVDGRSKITDHNRDTFKRRSSSAIWSIYHRISRVTFAGLGLSLCVQDVRDKNLELLQSIHRLSSSKQFGSATAQKKLPVQAKASRDKSFRKFSTDGMGLVAACKVKTVLFSFNSIVASFDTQTNAFRYNNCQPTKRLNLGQLKHLSPQYFAAGSEVKSSPRKFVYVLEAIGLKSVLRILSFLFANKSVVFISEYPTVRALAVESMVELMLPFRCQHICVPSLPTFQQDVLETMMHVKNSKPFLVGVHAHHLSQAYSSFEKDIQKKHHDPTIVNLDHGWVRYEKLNGSKETIEFPSHLKSILLQSVSNCVREFSNHIISKTLPPANIVPDESNPTIVVANSQKLQENICNAISKGFETMYTTLFTFCFATLATAPNEQPVSRSNKKISLEMVKENEREILRCMSNRTEAFLTSIFQQPVFHDFILRVARVDDHIVSHFWSQALRNARILSDKWKAQNGGAKSGWLTIAVLETNIHADNRLSKGNKCGYSKPKRKWCVLGENHLVYYFGKSKTKEKGKMAINMDTVIYYPEEFPFANLYSLFDGDISCLDTKISREHVELQHSGSRQGEDNDSMTNSNLDVGGVEKWFRVESKHRTIAIRPGDDFSEEFIKAIALQTMSPKTMKVFNML